MTDIKKIIEFGKFIKQSMLDGSYKQNPAFNEGILLFTSNAMELLKKQEEQIKKFELERSWDESPDMMGRW